MNFISISALTSTDTLNLNINPYANQNTPPQQHESNNYANQNTRQYDQPNSYPTMTNSLYPPAIPSTSASSSENDLSGSDDSNNRVRNKKRKANKARRLKRRRRPNQKKIIINKVRATLEYIYIITYWHKNYILYRYLVHLTFKSSYFAPVCSP